jgi:hypothetical protein
VTTPASGVPAFLAVDHESQSEPLLLGTVLAARHGASRYCLHPEGMEIVQPRVARNE